MLDTVLSETYRHGPCSFLQYFVSCDSVSSLPTFNFVLNGVEFPLSPSSYILQVRPHFYGQSRWDLEWSRTTMQRFAA